MEGEKLVHLSPDVILADDNSRYGLKRPRIDSLKANILEVGGVMSACEVETLPEKTAEGQTHRLTAGFYRHAAVTELNKEQQAGLTLPCVIRPTDPLTRLRHQISENTERENMSPMDEAVAMKRLLDAGVPRLEIRKVFARPSGKKGITLQPMSNAMLNIFVGFLDLPKTIQEKIHDGRVGVAAAYELGKVAPDRRQAVLERAEVDRIRQLEQEEKDEEKYLGAEKKLVESEQKAKEHTEEAEQLKAAVTVAKETLKEREKELDEIQKTPFLGLSDEEKKKVTRALTDKKAEVTLAKKAVKDSENAVAKALTARTKAEEAIDDAKAKLESVRKAAAKKNKKKAVGQADVKKAAEKEGASTGKVALNLSEIRVCVKDIAGQTEFPKVAIIGKLLRDCFDGGRTTKELIHDLAAMTGEKKAPQGVKVEEKAKTA